MSGGPQKTPLPRVLLMWLILFVAGTTYGYFATQHKWWVGDRLNDIREAFYEVLQMAETPWYLSFPRTGAAVATHAPDQVAEGLIALSGIGADREGFVRIVDRDGTVIQEWSTSWFELFQGKADWLPDDGRKPDRPPGADPHGFLLADNGDLVFNNSHITTMRVDPCGKTKWVARNLGHHSIVPARDGGFFVGGEKYIAEGRTGYVNHVAPLRSWTIQKLSADGELEWEKPVLDILMQNDLLGIALIGSNNNIDTSATGDSLHLNDVEEFPDDMASDVFAPGDLMISLRNASTILVVDPKTWKVKFQSTGQVLRQHDPDFEPGDKIVVFNNNNMEFLGPDEERASSIVEFDARTGQRRALYSGPGKRRFYSTILGKHQLLPNGNRLITSALQGLAFEIDPKGDVVWEISNALDESRNGLLIEAQLLPSFMTRDFFESARAACATH